LHLAVLKGVREARLSGAIDVEQYYRDYGPMVLRRCRRLLRNEEQALDAMQDTFVNLLKSESRLKHQAPSSLLFRIATNVCLNRIRARSRQPEDSDSRLLARIAAATSPEDSSMARFSLASLFSQQPESSQTIAALHLVDGLTLEQVAQQVGMSVSGVRKRIRKLKQCLTGQEGEQP
jgi:RNA polymerase sigma-70 factor (ECF subfamily)